MKQLGYNLEQNYVALLVQELNKYRFKKKEISLNGFIEYSQFLEITFDIQILFDVKNQELLFSYLDYDNKGYINIKNISNVLIREQISIEAID